MLELFLQPTRQMALVLSINELDFMSPGRHQDVSELALDEQIRVCLLNIAAITGKMKELTRAIQAIQDHKYTAVSNVNIIALVRGYYPNLTQVCIHDS